MDKSLKINFRNKTYHLLFNGNAMFFVEKIFGENELVKAIFAPGEEAWGKVCQLLAKLMEQGELVRRDEGHDPQPILEAEKIQLLAIPIEISNLRQAAADAVMIGYGREVKDENEVVDIGLLKHQKKRKQS